MSKIKCRLDGEDVECRVIENMGFQGGHYVKAVEHNGEERIVIKVNGIWRPKAASEKFGGFTSPRGT